VDKLDIVTDEEAKEFEKNLGELSAFLTKQEDHTYMKTLAIIMNDNVKMFNHIQELENGNTDTSKTE
jgi:hypothetical protein